MSAGSAILLTFGASVSEKVVGEDGADMVRALFPGERVVAPRVRGYCVLALTPPTWALSDKLNHSELKGLAHAT